MNVFHKVTLQSLKKNKTRTIVTIIGIMLSAAMICAVTTFVSSMQNYALEYAKYKTGDWHGAVFNAKWQDYEDINTTGKIEDSTYGQLLGYAKIDSQNEYKPYMFVMGCEKDFFARMPVHLISGRLPKNQSEILIPQHLSTNGGLTFKPGDTVTLELGDRLLDGFLMWQNNPCYTYDWRTDEETLNQEVIEVRQIRTYTVVGIYERPDFEELTAPGYTALTVPDQEYTDNTYFDVYFKMKDPKGIYEFMSSMDLGGTQNTDVLMYSGVSRYSSFSEMLTGLAIIVIGLIMFGSISLIYNAFSISVSERTKQFGLLSSIGATKKQLKKMVIFEALTVSAIGIPLGIAVGIGGIGVTLLLIGNKFSSMMGTYDAPMRICVSWEAVAAAVLIALVTVLISAWIPSKRATRISAVEAIRQSSDIQGKNKPVKTSKLTYKLFALPGVLASKHFKRSKKKYRATVISLFMSIVLFVSASSFTDYLMESVTGGFGTGGYDLVFNISENDLTEHSPDAFLELIAGDEDVTEAVYVSSQAFHGIIENRYVTQDFIDSSYSDDEGFQNINGYLVFVNDEAFQKMLSQYRLDSDDYFNKDHPLGIAMDKNTVFNFENERYETVDTLISDDGVIVCEVPKQMEGYTYIGDTVNERGEVVSQFENDQNTTDVVQVPVEDAYEQYTLQCGKTITEAPFYVRDSAPLTMFYPMSMKEAVLPAQKLEGFYYYNYYMTSDDHAESHDNLKRILSENGYDSGDLMDYAENVEMERNLVTIIQVFSYGFIVLISLIAAANVFNTISTNIGLRRREFAMLKSVGMTQKGFHQMMNYECILYGSKALLLGLPVSAVITYLIYMTVSGGYETVYHLPWGAIGIAVLSVFLVVFSTMLYAMGKIKKDNPIDGLKNENL